MFVYVEEDCGHVWRLRWVFSSIPLYLFILFLSSDLWVNVRLAGWARLTGEQAAGFFLRLPSQSWNYRQTFSAGVLGKWTQRPTLVNQALYQQNPLTRPVNSLETELEKFLNTPWEILSKFLFLNQGIRRSKILHSDEIQAD